MAKKQPTKISDLISATEKNFTIKSNGKELSDKEIQKYLQQIEPKQ